MKIADIKIGRRHRKDMGDIDGLALSMSERGLIQPVAIRPDNTLVAGARRLVAAKKLGWTEIDVHVCHSPKDELDYLQAERDENTCRQGWTPTEAVTLGLEIERLLAAKAKERKRAGKSSDGSAGGRGKKKGEKPSSESDEGFSPGASGRTDDAAGAALGLGRDTYRKAKEVVAAAKEEPRLFGDLPKVMDTKSVNAAHREMKRRAGVSDGAANETKPRRSERTDDEQENPENVRTAYLLRADVAMDLAKREYSGPVTRDIVDVARRVASAWVELAEVLEASL